VKDEKALSQFSDLHKRFGALSEQRNKLMHSHWYIAEFGTGFNEIVFGVRRDRITKRVKRGWELEIDSPSSKSLRDLTENVKLAERELTALTFANTKIIKQHRRKTPKFPTYLMLHMS